VHLVAVEVFEAALDAAAQEDPDLKKRDLQGALPPIREDTWQEVRTLHGPFRSSPPMHQRPR
jgi:hypothetical protein